MTFTSTYDAISLSGAISISAASGVQSGATVVTTTNGNSIVFYYDVAVNEVAARTVSAAGVLGARTTVSNSSVLIEAQTFGDTDPLDAVRLSNGNIVVTWTSNEATPGTYFRIFDANLNPITAGTRITSSGLIHPDIAGTANGGFVVAGELIFSATDHDIFAYRYSANGIFLGADVINSGGLFHDRPTTAGLSDGGYVVAYSDVNLRTTFQVSVHNADGTQRSSSLQSGSDGRYDLNAVALTNGGFEVLYQSNSSFAVLTNQINGLIFTAAGTLLTSVTHTDTTQRLGLPTTSVSPDGYIALSLTQEYNQATNDFDILFDLIAPDGTPLTVSGGALTGSFARESVSNVTWLDASTLRVTYQTNAAFGSDSDAGIVSSTFSLRRNTTGDAADDVINFAGDNFINNIAGGNGNDIITGGNLDDYLSGENNNDTLSGGPGIDFLDGGAGTNQLLGGLGDDSYIITNGIDTITELPGEGNDTILTSLSTFTLNIANVENLSFIGVGNSTLTGNSGSNRIYGGSGGTSTMIGAGGNDILDGTGNLNNIASYVTNAGAIYADIAAGYVLETSSQLGTTDGSLVVSTDTLVFVNNITGSSYGDRIYGNGNSNSLIGGAGNDIIYAEGGDDVVRGGAGADVLIGGIGTDTLVYSDAVGSVYLELYAGFALETGLLTGTVGAATPLLSTNLLTQFENADGSNFGDRIYGTDGVNRIDGRSGDDIIYAEGGDDFVIGGAGSDILLGGSGTDTLDYSGSVGAVYADLAGFTIETALQFGTVNGGTAAISNDLYAQFENLNGSVYGDRLYGDAGINSINGNDGDDFIYGGNGNDILSGGNGADILVGEGGADTLTGGAGADRFFFTTAPVIGAADTITDFVAGTDKIWLNRGAFGIGAAEALLPVYADPSGNFGSYGVHAFLIGFATPGVPSSQISLFYDSDGSAGALAPILVASIFEVVFPAFLPSADLVLYG
jgi:Ca2+-binding RTX toxin-like protein